LADHRWIIKVNPATFTVVLTNPAPQTTYFYRFYAVNANPNGIASSSAQFTTAINPPDYSYRMKVTKTS